jgi:hypothetical protein
MKQFRNLLALFAFGALALGTAQAQQSRPGFATAIRTSGEVSYTLGDGKWNPLVPGKYLPPGSIIRTGDNGTVDIILGKSIELPQAKWAPERISQAPDSPVRGMITYQPSAEQNMVRLIPNTTLSIDRLNTTDTGADTVSDTELDLKDGKIYASVKKLSGASQYLVKVPNGVAGVRGTWFSLGALGEVAVYESTGGGLLLAVTIKGTPYTVQVNPGFQFSPSSIIAGGGTGGTGGGQPSATPIPPEVLKTLAQVFDALKTIFIERVSVATDNTTTHVSAVSGVSGATGNGDVTPTPTPIPTPIPAPGGGGF